MFSSRMQADNNGLLRCYTCALDLVHVQVDGYSTALLNLYKRAQPCLCQTQTEGCAQGPAMALQAHALGLSCRECGQRVQQRSARVA
jgi:hypothetical protein